jgi:hypothetical protein
MCVIMFLGGLHIQLRIDESKPSMFESCLSATGEGKSNSIDVCWAQPYSVGHGLAAKGQRLSFPDCCTR